MNMNTEEKGSRLLKELHFVNAIRIRGRIFIKKRKNLKTEQVRRVSRANRVQILDQNSGRGLVGLRC